MGEYKSAINPEKRGKRRAKWHDYTKPWYYMITITKATEQPLFSNLYIKNTPLSFIPKSEIDPALVYCNYTKIGFLICDQIAIFNRKHPEAKIENRIIMPDHIHFIFHVKQKLRDKSEFGRLIAQFKGACSRALSEFKGTDHTLPIKAIFERGFNDKICFRSGQLDKFKNYIKDNPRRLAFKKLRPDLFTTTMKIKIGEEYYKVIGNIFLLKHPLVEQVRFSRKFSTEEWSKRKLYLQRIIEDGGVVVSPFIHSEENAIFKAAEEAGAGIIYIRNRDYGERDKPEWRLFDLCAEGRLLIIAVGEEGKRRNEVSRAEAMRMNNLAYLIATNPGQLLLKRSKE